MSSSRFGARRRPAVPTAAILASPASSSHRRDRIHGARDRLRREPPVVAGALAEPGDLGAVDDRFPVLLEQELDRIRADVDDAGRGSQALERPRNADVQPALEPELAHAGKHSHRIF